MMSKIKNECNNAIKRLDNVIEKYKKLSKIKIFNREPKRQADKLLNATLDPHKVLKPFKEYEIIKKYYSMNRRVYNLPFLPCLFRRRGNLLVHALKIF